MGGGSALQAQNKPITGSVASLDGPIIGATIVVEGTSSGTTTNSDGQFSIPAPANAILIISFIGYETQKIATAGKTNISVQLKEDALSIDQVTVVGYGTGSKVGTNIGSVAKIKGEELENRPVPNLADALQGKVAGLAIYTSSGEPSAKSTIRLHGVGSLTAGTAPLFVLDGVPVSESVFSSLSDNNIESVSVLKDASATSIYGSRAANGVVFITTKRGTRNQEVAINVAAHYGIAQPATGKYEVMSSAEVAAFQLQTGSITQSRHDQILKSGINTNWRDYYYKSAAPLYQIDLSASGGSEKTSYFLSGSYNSHEGTAPGSSLERYSFRSNVDIVAKNWLRIGATVGLGLDKTSKAQTNTNSVYNAAFMSLLSLPYESPYDDAGREKELISGYSNPNYMIKKHPSQGTNLQVNGSAYIQITPIKNLNIKSQFGTDAYAYWSHAYGMPSYIGSMGNGTVSRAHQNAGTFTSTTTIDYNFEFANPRHKLYLMAGQEGIRSNTLLFSAQKSGQPTDELMMISTGSGTSSATDNKQEYVMCSWFGRGEYSFADKYLIDASIRRDASSRFGEKNRAGLFYSFGFMWNLKKERFLASNSVISDLRLKVSYGTQGNSEITNYAHRSHLAATTYNEKTGLYLASAGNADLGWEMQKHFSVTAIIGLIDRINLEAGFYNRQTSNMLMDVPMPGSSGYTSESRNVGGMLNRGLDLTLNANIVRTKDWNLNFKATFNYNRNRITSLFDGQQQYVIASSGVCYAVGHDGGEFYMQKFVGVNPENGNSQWETIDDQGVRGKTEDFNKATQQLLGKSWWAPYTGGFGFDVSWKGLSLWADFTWTYGKYLMNNGLVFLEDPTYSGSFNRSKRLLDRWQKPGDVTDVPRYDCISQFDSHILEDASFLRLKNLTISYTFPQALIQKSGFMKGFRIYFTTRNLFTVTGYTGYDPEIDFNVALGDYPNTREFVGGIQLTF